MRRLLATAAHYCPPPTHARPSFESHLRDSNPPVSTVSAHTYTRGTWTTPEGTHADRDLGSTDYVAAGVHTAPTYLKWMLLFEEPSTRTVWLAKATPREWLSGGSGQAPIMVHSAPTRYGRISFSLHVLATHSSPFTVVANVTLPSTYIGATAPPGGIRLRMRVPLDHAGKLSYVTVGGKEWVHFDAAAETVNFAPEQLTAALVDDGLHRVVAQWR